MDYSSEYFHCINCDRAQKLENRLRAASSLSKEFQQYTNIMALAVVGSTARCWFDENSDIDLFVIHKNDVISTNREMSYEYGGYQFNISFVDYVKLTDYFSQQYTDLPKLRLAANLEVSKSIYEMNNSLQEFRKVNSTLTLEKDIIFFYLRLIEENLTILNESNDILVIKLSANICIQSAILLLLSFSLVRAIKPKWNWKSINLIDSKAAYFCSKGLSLDKLAPSLNHDFLRYCIELLFTDTNNEKKKIRILRILNDAIKQEGNQDFPAESSAYLRDCIFNYILNEINQKVEDCNSITSEVYLILTNNLNKNDIINSIIQLRKIVYRHIPIY